MGADVSVEERVWYLAAGGKQVGPMTAERVIERIRTGKVPKGTKAWKDGMPEWLEVGAVPELASGEADAPEVEETGAEAAPAQPMLPARVPAAKNGSGVAARPRRTTQPRVAASERAAPAGGGLVSRLVGLFSADELPLTFVPPYRTEKADRWSAFSLGFDKERLKLASLAMAGAAIPLVGIFVPLLGMGALSYQMRHQVTGQKTPSFRESMGFAWNHMGALIGVPLALLVSVLAPLLTMVILDLVLKVPYAGPIVTGLIYGVHLALGALTLFLIVAALVSFAFAPVIVGFEETTFGGTIQVLFDFVKRSIVRVILWGFTPGLVFLGFALLVQSIFLMCVAIPFTISTAVAGLPLNFLEGGSIGQIFMGFWIGAAGLAVFGILMSVRNALDSILYLAGRRGNDALPQRDAVIAAEAAANIRRAEVVA